jgi:high-affinity nickel-transport protein
VTSVFWLALAGFALGARHATDADHVVAIAAIISRERSLRGAARVGVLWSIGHTLTVFVFGGAVILSGVDVPGWIGLLAELAVGTMLVVLGVLTLRQARVQQIGSAPLFLPAQSAGQADQNDAVAADTQRPRARHDEYPALRPLAVGVVHGMAGSAAIALVALAAIGDRLWAFAYLVLFGMGTVAGMLLVTAAIAIPFAYSAGRMPRFNHSLRVAAGLLSLALGLGLILYTAI